MCAHEIIDVSGISGPPDIFAPFTLPQVLHDINYKLILQIPSQVQNMLLGRFKRKSQERLCSFKIYVIVRILYLVNVIDLKAQCGLYDRFNFFLLLRYPITLRDYMQKNPNLPVETSLMIFTQLVEAVAHLVDNDVSHR